MAYQTHKQNNKTFRWNIFKGNASIVGCIGQVFPRKRQENRNLTESFFVGSHVPRESDLIGNKNYVFAHTAEVLFYSRLVFEVCCESLVENMFIFRLESLLNIITGLKYFHTFLLNRVCLVVLKSKTTVYNNQTHNSSNQWNNVSWRNKCAFVPNNYLRQDCLEGISF